MIAIDTSVWVDHFRNDEPELARMLRAGNVIQHPYVTGELAMGSLGKWLETVEQLRGLPVLNVVSDDDFYRFVHEHGLVSSGLGYVDGHLLAALANKDDAKLWTRDRRLESMAEKLGLRADL